MKKGHQIAIAAALIMAVLAGAYFWGGNYAKSDTTTTPNVTDKAALSPESHPPASVTKPMDEPDASADSTDERAAAPRSTPQGSGEVEKETKSSSAPTRESNPETGKDEELTAPLPEGHPLPVEPQDVTMTDTAFFCTLSVRCDTIRSNMSLLDKEKWELVPDDGVIYAAQSLTVYEGESVFNVLQRAMKQAAIPMEFVNTLIYNSIYIEGINNLYEFDVGELSGWVYQVNGWFPNYGCSRYQLKEGDVIEWVYSCDLGQDVGGSNATGG